MIDQKFARRGLFLVFLILFLDVIGIAIIMPVMPKYLEELTGASVSTAGCCWPMPACSFCFHP